MIYCKQNKKHVDLPIKGFIEASLIDYPMGKPGSVIFIAGCDSRCPPCQASHLVENHHQLASITVQEVLAALSELKGFIQGVTVTGGEVTIHKNLAESLLRPLLDMDYQIKLHTYGARIDRLSKWIKQGFVHALAVDIKGPWSRYEYLLGRKVSKHDILALQVWVNSLIKCAQIPSEFRTTVHPRLLSTDEIMTTARQVTNAEFYILQNYSPVPGFDPSLQDGPFYSYNELRDLSSKIQNAGIVKHCFVKGFEKDISWSEIKKCGCF
jgi:pyruvate formate lyase activating enzyme